MKTKQKKLKFSKGEVNPKLLERQDLGILDSSASHIKNMISTPYGSVKTRTGTTKISKVVTNLEELTQPWITSYAGEWNPVTEVFSDDFDRTDGAPGNDWTVTREATPGGGAGGDWRIVSNELQMNWSTGGLFECRCTRDNETYGANYAVQDIAFDFTFYQSPGGTGTQKLRIVTQSNEATEGSDGIGLEIDNVADTISVIRKNVVVDSTAKTITNSTTYSCRLYIDGVDAKLRVWTGAEPDVWDIDTAATDAGDGIFLNIWGVIGTPGANYYRININDLVVEAG
ncbi:MAG: hypothetical protein GY861_15945 [bacterium]|nr:hypothetical protein [bacterium]